MVYQPINGHLYPTHRLADEWNLRHEIYPEQPGTHRHHIDHDRRNNRPVNLERKPAADHIRLHNSQNLRGGLRPPGAWRGDSARRSSDALRTPSGRRVSRVRRPIGAASFWQDERYRAIRERVDPSQAESERSNSRSASSGDAAQVQRPGRTGTAKPTQCGGLGEG